MTLRRSSAWQGRPGPGLDHPRGATEHGSVLLQVLFLSVLGLLFSGMLLSGLLLQAHSIQRSRRAPQVSYAAESGVHRTIQHLVNAVSEEKGAIDQFRVLAAPSPRKRGRSTSFAFLRPCGIAQRRSPARLARCGTRRGRRGPHGQHDRRARMRLRRRRSRRTNQPG